MSASPIKMLVSNQINKEETQSEKLSLSDKQITSTLENDSFFYDDDLRVEDECTQKHSICTSNFNTSSKLINEKGKLKEFYETINPLCSGSEGVKPPPGVFLKNPEPLFAFRRKQTYNKSDCEAEGSEADFSNIYSLSDSSDSESLSLGTFRSNLLSEN
ncbi:unnamed protein product [Moneuplotes crassus]|uniref:Uncharacterized protein n=1 Tax=Euplotes crassus TaxID=5936 RepID=A0AAD1XHE5_EUPCR|nr:unnamed protein product [Moneuplotes crassus]